MTTSSLHTSRRRLLAGVLVLLCLVAGTARGAEVEEVNPGLAAQLFLKILGYDRNLVPRAGGRLVLAIVYRENNAESEHIRDGIQAAFQERATRVQVQGKTVTVTTIPYDAKNLTKRLESAGATILYVTPGIDDQAGAVPAAALALKAPTLTGRRSLLDGGLAIAVVTNDDKPGIVINLPVAKALGMDLDPNLLRLAELKK